MTRKKFAVMLLFCLFLCSCSIAVDTNTPKSAELSEKYEFYEKSVTNIRSSCQVTPEEADEIFLVLVDGCGVSDLINYVFKNSDGTFTMWSSGQKYIVTLEDNIVSAVSTMDFLTEVQLYPKEESDAEEEIRESNNNNNDIENPIVPITDAESSDIDSSVPDLSNVLFMVPVKEAPIMKDLAQKELAREDS